MARPQKIWYWKARKQWFATINGQRYKLGTDKDAAKIEFYRLMSQVPPKQALDSLAVHLDSFVVYSEEYKATKTVRWYRDYLQDFLDWLKSQGYSPATMHPIRVTPKLVRAWANERDKGKRGRITAVKAAFRWLQGEGSIAPNPIAGMRRPPAGKREEFVSLPEVKQILRAA